MSLVDQLMTCLIDPDKAVEFARDVVERTLNLNGIVVKNCMDCPYTYHIGVKLAAEFNLQNEDLIWHVTPSLRHKQLIHAHVSLLGT